MSGNTAIFDVWLTLHDLLSSASFTPSPEYGSPAVWLGDPHTPPAAEADAAERIVVIPTTGDAAQDVANISDRPGRDEVFTVPVAVVVAARAMTPREMTARLSVLTGEALEVVRAVTRTVDRPAALSDAGVWFWEASQVKAALVPTEGGWLGQAEITVTVKARL